MALLRVCVSLLMWALETSACNTLAGTYLLVHHGLLVACGAGRTLVCLVHQPRVPCATATCHGRHLAAADLHLTVHRQLWWVREP